MRTFSQGGMGGLPIVGYGVRSVRMLSACLKSCVRKDHTSYGFFLHSDRMF